MKILIISPTLGNGGAERLATQLAIQQKSDGEDVNVLSYYPNNNFRNYDELINNGVGVITLDKKPGVDISMFYKINHVIQSIKPDIIQTHVDSVLYILPIKRITVFHTVHSMAWYEAKGLQKLVRSIAYKHKGVVPIAIGDTIRESISSYYKMDEKDIPVIYNGSTIKPYYKEKAYGEEITFCITGTLSKVKNHQLLLRAFGEIKRKGIPFKLLVLGDGDQKTELIPLAQSQNIESEVRFLGYQKDVGRYLKEADVYVCCSHVEGISIAIIEALFYGLPVLASNVGGNPDLVKDGYNGLLFDDDDFQGLVKQIEILANDKQLLKKMSQNSYAEAPKYTIKACSDAYLSLYKSRINERKGEQFQ